MFVLSELKDVVRIPPWKFKRKLNDAISDELNRKLSNKDCSEGFFCHWTHWLDQPVASNQKYGFFMLHIVQRKPIIALAAKTQSLCNHISYRLIVYLNVGLCIALHDITKIEESYIFPGDGSSHTKVVFRFIVFRPFMEEILLGKIRSCSADGVHVTLGFFEDIIIPPHKLQHPSRFDQTEQVWVWEYDTGDGEKHDLFMDAGETVRFRVVSESFVETLPTGPTVAGESVEKPEAKGISPYTLGAAIDEPGLGLLTWWENT